MEEHQDPHTEAESPTPEERLEELLQALWDRVRQAGELVATLRSRNHELQGRLGKIESEFEGLRKDLTDQKKLLLEKNEQIRTLQHQVSEGEGKMMSNGDKEALLAKAKELLGRIEGYL